MFDPAAGARRLPQRPLRSRAGPRRTAAPGPGYVHLPARLHQAAAADGGHRCAGPHHVDGWRRSIPARTGERGQRRGEPDQIHHFGQRRRARSRRVARRHEARVLAAPAARSRTRQHRSEAAQLEDLPVRRRRQDRHPADQRRHHARPRRRRALPARRAHRVRLDAPAGDAGDPARRGATAIPGADRRPPAGHLPAARHERRRHRHASDQLQHQPRLRALGAGQRPDRVLALGSRPTAGSDQPVPHQPGRHRPAALLRRQQPCDRRQHRGHQQQRHPVPERRASAATASCSPDRPGRSLSPARSSRAATSCSSTARISWKFISRPSRSDRPARHRGTGQASATTLGVTTDANLPSLGGRFASMLPAVRRHQSHAGELGALPDRQPDDFGHRGVHIRQYRRRRRQAGAAAIHPLGVRFRHRER